MKKIAPYFFVLFLFLVPFLALGYEATEEGLELLLIEEIPIVVTSTLEKVSLDESPSALTVVTDKEIELYGYRALPDLFRTVAGIQYWKSGTEERTAVVRGYRGGHYTLKYLLDGRSLNDRYDGQTYGWDDISLVNVKQIEIVRGPGSALYGSGAFTGVINIITKKTPGLTMETGYGEWNSKRGMISYYSPNDSEFQFGVQVEGIQEDGPEITVVKDALYGTPFSLTPKTMERSFERTGVSLFTEFRNVEANFYYVDFSKIWTEGFGGVISDSPIYNDEKRYEASVSWKHDFSDELKVNYTLDYSLVKPSINGQRFPKGISFGTDINGDGVIETWREGMWISATGDDEEITNKILLEWAIEDHHLFLEADYAIRALDNVEHESNFGVLFEKYFYYVPMQKWQNDSQKWLTREVDDEVFSVMFQDIYRMHPSLSITAGVRYDRYSEYGQSSTNPRFDLVWTIKDYIVKAGYATAFTIPTYGYRYYGNNGGFSGNPDLDPEEIESFEISLGNSYIKPFHYSFTVFKNTITDGMNNSTAIVNGNRIQTFLNVVKVENWGIECEFNYRILENFNLWGNYSYLDSEDESTGYPYKYSSKHQGNLGFSWRFLKNAYISAHYFITDDRQSSYIFSETFDGYDLLNSAIVYKPTERLTLSLTAHNLLDEAYYGGTDKFHQQDPRQVFFKVKYRTY